MHKHTGRLAALAVAGVLATVGLAGGASAQTTAYAPLPLPANSVGPTQIQTGGVWGVDIHDNTIGYYKMGSDFRANVNKTISTATTAASKADAAKKTADQALAKANDPSGKVTGLESDGPYPGATKLQEGDNSTAYWANDGKLQRSWVMCPAGKVALGGGYTAAADASLADKLATQIVTSAPVQVKDGNPEAYTPIAGDKDGSFVPNGWLVEGVYTGTNDKLIVRPHITCAKIG